MEMNTTMMCVSFPHESFKFNSPNGLKSLDKRRDFELLCTLIFGIPQGMADNTNLLQ